MTSQTLRRRLAIFLIPVTFVIFAGVGALTAALSHYQAGLLRERGRSLGEVNDARQMFGFVIALGVLTLVLVALAMWVALRRWVVEPLERLGHEVDRVHGGDLSHRIGVSGAPVEVSVLAEQVDRMRLRILEEYALVLEARQTASEAHRLLAEQAEDLQRSNAELEQFAYVASHDLQEPLRKVASFCQLLERRYRDQLDERGVQYIDFAVDGAKRMQNLINDLLAFSRVGRLTAEFAPVNLEDAFAQALRQLDVLIEEAGAVVTHDPLPTVVGDASLLVQLFQNLVGNAVKFRRDQPPRVHVGARADGERWEMWCSDNGIGIEPQYADKIFIIFQRLHGREAYGGTGIGLAMCKKIVEHHNGTMWLDADVTDGTTIRWTLPRGTGHIQSRGLGDVADLDDRADLDNRADLDDRADLDGGNASHDSAAAATAGRGAARGGRSR